MKYIQSYFTDIGTKRKTNQDSLALLKADTDFGEVLLAVICDGMGGHQYGELASKTIVKHFEKWFKMEFPILLYSGIDEKLLFQEWDRLIRGCNAELVKYGDERSLELGSTLTAILLVEDHYYFAHVGDSRLYEITDEHATQLTQDHSLIAEEIRNGVLTEEEAKKDKRKNMLLECVGITNSIKIDFGSERALQKACYLLCTDGFWHKISGQEMTHYLRGAQFPDNKMLRMHLNYLVEEVKSRGEKDNITAIGIVPEKEN